MATTRGTWTIKIGGEVFADYTDLVQRGDNDGGPDIIETKGFGAAAAAQTGNGNFRMARQFTVTLEFSDNKTATDFFETAAQTWAGVADVVLVHMDSAGKETSYSIPAAAVRVVAQQPVNVAVTVRLTVTGGPTVILA